MTTSKGSSELRETIDLFRSLMTPAPQDEGLFSPEPRETAPEPDMDPEPTPDPACSPDPEPTPDPVSTLDSAPTPDPLPARSGEAEAEPGTPVIVDTVDEETSFADLNVLAEPTLPAEAEGGSSVEENPVLDLDPSPEPDRDSVEPPPTEASPEAIAEPEARGLSRAERLEDVLIQLCRRAGAGGAVLADEAGLPLAAYNSPVDHESVAALTSILGDSLRHAGRLLQRRDINHISLDVDYEDRMVLRRFAGAGTTFYLVALCPQALDDRAEMELTSVQLIEIIGGREQ